VAAWAEVGMAQCGTGCKAGNAVVLHRGSRRRHWELVVSGEFVIGLVSLAEGFGKRGDCSGRVELDS
jgi:hypothetical protein